MPMTQEEMDALLGDSGYGPKDAATAPIPDEAIAAADPLPTAADVPHVDEYINGGTQAVAPEAGLDDYIGKLAEEAPTEPEPEPSPAAPYQPKADKYAPQQAPVLAQTQGTQSQLVSTKPDWYESLAPPKVTGAEKAIPGILGAFLTAATGPKKDAAKNFFGGVAPTVGAFMDAPQEDYQNRLKSAGAQADMHAKLASGGGNVSLLNYDLARQKFEWLQSKFKDKAELERRLHDVNSPESKEIRDALVSGGAFKPEVAAKLNGAQLNQARVAAQQQAGADRNQGNWIGRYNIGQTGKVEGEGRANTEWDRRQGAEQEQQIGKEGREQVKLDEQAEIPGFHYVGKRAPNIAAVEKARVLSDGLASAETSADNLIDIWGKLSNRAKLTPGWLEGTLSPEDLDLVSEAKIWATNLDTAQRNLANMGVPQQFEMALIKQINPDPSGIRAFLNDGASWRAQKRVMQKTANKRMKNYGYASESEPDAMPVHGTHKTLPQKLQEAGQATKETVGQAVDAGKQVVSGAVDTAGQVAKDVVAPAAKMFKVQVMGPDGSWSKVRDATEEQYRNAVKKLGVQKLRLVQ